MLRTISTIIFLISTVLNFNSFAYEQKSTGNELKLTQLPTCSKGWMWNWCYVGCNESRKCCSDVIDYWAQRKEECEKDPVRVSNAIKLSCKSCNRYCQKFNVTKEKGGEEKMLTVTGRLVKVGAIGGETPGWAIEVDSTLEVKGEKFNKIEIDPKDKKVDNLENKRVGVIGTLAKYHGIERGYYWVIAVEKIKELTTEDSKSKENAISTAKKTLAKHIKIDEKEIEVISVRDNMWGDTSLGCPEPGKKYLQVVTFGYVVILKARGKMYEYHVSRGSTIVVLCKDKK